MMRAKSQPGVAPRRVVAIAMVVVDEDVASSALLLATALRRHVSRDFGGPFQDGSLVVAMQDLSCVLPSFSVTVRVLLRLSSFPLDSRDEDVANTSVSSFSSSSRESVAVQDLSFSMEAVESSKPWE